MHLWPVVAYVQIIDKLSKITMARLQVLLVITFPLDRIISTERSRRPTFNHLYTSDGGEP